MKHYQFTIIGGGLVGATAALALARFGLPVSLVEASACATANSFSELSALNTPTIALSYASRQFFESLKIWKSIEPYTQAIKSVHVSTQGHWGSSCLSQHEEHYAELGYVVGVEDLKSTLNYQLKQHKNLTVLNNNRLTSFEFIDGKWICGLSEHPSLSTHLLISAEGVHSIIRQQLKLGQTSTQYPHQALMANIRLSKSLSGIAVERFIENGVIALLPWRNNYATMVLSLPEAELTQYKAMTDESIVQKCQKALGETYGLIQAIGKKNFIPLNMVLAQQQFYKQLLLLGNSAHSLHPIAAQGFNLSLRDIQRLYNQIVTSNKVPSWGSTIYDLNAYVVACLRDQQKTIAGTDRLARSVEQIPNVLKALGVSSLDCMAPVKNQFTRLAMGLDF